MSDYMHLAELEKWCWDQSDKLVRRSVLRLISRFRMEREVSDELRTIIRDFPKKEEKPMTLYQAENELVRRHVAKERRLGE